MMLPPGPLPGLSLPTISMFSRIGGRWSLAGPCCRMLLVAAPGAGAVRKPSVLHGRSPRAGCAAATGARQSAASNARPIAVSARRTGDGMRVLLRGGCTVGGPGRHPPCGPVMPILNRNGLSAQANRRGSDLARVPGGVGGDDGEADDDAEIGRAHV